jgi:hypothetical protein
MATSWAGPGLSPPCLPFQQRFQDTSQYVCAELQALEQEQRQIDGRAAEVETQLRSLMESGGVGTRDPLLTHQICLALQLLLSHRAHFTDGHANPEWGRSLLEAHSSGFWDPTRKQAPFPKPQLLCSDRRQSW